jgi:hypothetical protein
MMGFVVQHDDVFHAHQIGHDAMQHLAFGFQSLHLLAAPAFDRVARSFGDVDAFAQFEGVVVGDDDFGAGNVRQHVGRHQFAVLVVALGIVGQQHAQSVADCDAGGNDQKPVRELAAVRMSCGIDRLPGDQHGHNGGFARARGEFQRQAHQLRIGLRVRALYVRPKLGGAGP